MQAYLEIYTSRVRINEQIVFRSTKGDDLALYLSNSIDIELKKTLSIRNEDLCSEQRKDAF